MATSLKINEAMKSRVKLLAVAKGHTPHYLMCEALEQYVTREEQRLSLPERPKMRGPNSERQGYILMAMR
jgi:predicted transcriptional regulator